MIVGVGVRGQGHVRRSRRTVVAAPVLGMLAAVLVGCSSTPDTTPPAKPKPPQQYLLALRATNITTRGHGTVTFVKFTNGDLLRYGRAVCRSGGKDTAHGAEVARLIHKGTMSRLQALTIRTQAEHFLCK